jgi:5'-nucleotidase
MSARRLYIDLDGVLADFDGHFEPTFGFDHRGRDEEMWEAIKAHGSYFRSLPPCPGAIEFFESVRKLDPHILTACPVSDYHNVAQQKIAWVREHLGAGVTVLPSPGGRAKPLFMRSVGDCLIDDFEKNCRAWTEAGGYAIRHEGDWLKTRGSLEFWL